VAITPRSSHRWLWLAAALPFGACLALLVAERVNGRFSGVDFEVFHTAASRALRGEDLYRPGPDGYYQFKYGPQAALLFAPFTPLPADAAKIAWYLVVAAIATANLLLGARLAAPGEAGRDPARVTRIVLLVAAISSVHVIAELHLGQVNQLLLGAYLLMGLALSSGRARALGALLAASLFVKPFALIFLPYLALRRRWRELAYAAGFTAAFAAAPLATFAPAALARQYAGWASAVGAELATKADLLRPGNHTIFSILVRHTPLRLLPQSATAGLALRAAVLALLAAAIVAFVRAGRRVARPEAAETALVVALIPLIAFTSANAFGATTPALFVLLFAWRGCPRLRLPTAAGALLVGVGHWDILGPRGFATFEALSLVGIGALLLLAALALGRRAGAF
jgi:hypothetical protein